MKDFIVYALLLDGKGGASKLDEQALQTWTPEQGVLWVHLDYSVAGCRDWLESHLDLDEICVDAITAEETRPRVAVHQQGLLAALRGVNMNPNADPEDMVSIRLYVDADKIVSTRRRRILSVQDIVASLEAGEGPCSSAEFLAELSQRLVRRIGDPINEAEDSVDLLEESLDTAPRNKLRNELGQLRRQCIALRRYLAPQKEALNALYREKLAWFDEAAQLHIREAGDQLSIYIDALDSIRERASVTQEELVNQINEDSNNRMYLLSIVSAIFLPLGFATGVLGVNVGGIPGADNAYAFMIFVGVMIAIAGGMLAWFRRKKWI